MELETSQQAGGPHHFLAQLAGSWAGDGTLWFEPDKPPAAEHTFEGSFTLRADGLWAQFECSYHMLDTDVVGNATIATDLGRDQWQIAWIDSFHTGNAVMLSVGPIPAPGSEGPALDVLTSYAMGDSPPWGWRTTLELVTPDELLYRHKNITPDGLECPAVELRLQRR